VLAWCVCMRVCVCMCVCVCVVCVCTDVQGWLEPFIYGVHMVILTGKSPNIRSYTVYIYGSGQPYRCVYVCVRAYLCVFVCLRLWWNGVQGRQRKFAFDHSRNMDVAPATIRQTVQCLQ